MDYIGTIDEYGNIKKESPRGSKAIQQKSAGGDSNGIIIESNDNVNQKFSLKEDTKSEKITPESGSLAFSIKENDNITARTIKYYDSHQGQASHISRKALDAGFDAPKADTPDMALLSYASRKMAELRDSIGDMKFSMKEEETYWKNNLAHIKQLPENMPLIVGGTPEYLRRIGLSNIPLALDKTHANEILEGKADSDHAIDIHNINKLPELIKNPVAVIKSRSEIGKNTSVIIIMDLEQKGKHVMAPIFVSSYGDKSKLLVDCNIITSIHGRRNVYNLIEDAIKTEEVNGVGIYTVDGKKMEGKL